MPKGVGYWGASNVIFQRGNKNKNSGNRAAKNMINRDFFIALFF
tara:strand:- start:20 stop:151 length:132 start_codon:yes stop_codon:yes gene_type:complete